MSLRVKKIIKRYILIVRQIIIVLDFYFFKSRKLKKADVLFFFPFFHTGGAEQIHLNIVKALKNKKNCVLITGKSSSNNFLNEFRNNSQVIEVNNYFHSNFAKSFMKKKVISIINDSNNLISVFGCNCTFFYEVLPHLKKSVKKIDLIHAFSTPDYGIEQVSINSISFLDKRVVINEKTKLDLVNQYNLRGIEPALINRINKIENGIEIPNNRYVNKAKERIRIGYVGRWSNEKRPELFLKIAKKVIQKYPNVEFVIIGSQMEKKSNLIKDFGVNPLGEIMDKEKIENEYKAMNILLVTSYREGFPVVIMEAMAQSVVPISTKVGGISEHIKNHENGILVNNNENEEIIINDFYKEIEVLLEHHDILDELSYNAYVYSLAHFNIGKFNESYLKLLVYGS